MDRPDYQAEIRELNLAYLMLAQQMLRGDRATALFRLGISDALADLIESMSAAKLVRMARCCCRVFASTMRNLPD